MVRLLKRMCKILVIIYILFMLVQFVAATPYGASSIKSDASFIIGPQSNQKREMEGDLK